MPSITRRRILLLLGGSAGITAVGGIALAEPRSPHVIVNNVTDSETHVSTTVRTEDGTTVVDDAVFIPAGDDYGYTDLVAGEPLTVTIRAGGGRSAEFRWEDTAAENGLSVAVTPEKIGFAVAKPP